jgi:hypothetical protein
VAVRALAENTALNTRDCVMLRHTLQVIRYWCTTMYHSVLCSMPPQPHALQSGVNALQDASQTSNEHSACTFHMSVIDAIPGATTPYYFGCG